MIEIQNVLFWAFIWFAVFQIVIRIYWRIHRFPAPPILGYVLDGRLVHRGSEAAGILKWMAVSDSPERPSGSAADSWGARGGRKPPLWKASVESGSEMDPRSAGSVGLLQDVPGCQRQEGVDLGLHPLGPLSQFLRH